MTDKELLELKDREYVSDAAQTIINAMRADPEYAWSWHCNIAMAFFDAGGDPYTANHGAAKFMRMLADVEPSHELPAPQAAQDQGLIATLAGLESSIGHLSAIVDQQRALLAEVEDVFGRDERGIPFEDGESSLIDKVRAHLACIAAPQAPQPL